MSLSENRLIEKSKVIAAILIANGVFFLLITSLAGTAVGKPPEVVIVEPTSIPLVPLINFRLHKPWPNSVRLGTQADEDAIKMLAMGEITWISKDEVVVSFAWGTRLVEKVNGKWQVTARQNDPIPPPAPSGSHVARSLGG